ncbi:hypothetical protein L9H26_11660 [Morganella psychrotolerans]|uniref:Uncharacterized protein n=1 Tax=Morganella psychrotolerans TaxID=368603 RepID=A0A5M9R594_9GAMM|nr:hypothetical protein [Morganella psychrotolerans]KAA8715417.1 hypothetical protein F4V73_10595 [Morganella psychrotolerans]OBU05465.1 hypothetical protein AYY16_09395 [Morganella psychrotolerans]
MSSFKTLPPVSSVPGISDMLSNLADKEQSAYRDLNFPGAEKTALHNKTTTLHKQRRGNSKNDVMMLIENQVAMAKWHTEINFYSRITHLGISAVDSVVKGQ